MSEAKNIEYKSPEIEAFYRTHRVRWDQFYESERVIFSALELGAGSAVLDIGCGCGGLGLALREKFGLTRYTGVEINRQAAESAQNVYPQGRFLAADILDPPPGALADSSFDMVASLGCIDWNLQFSAMFAAAWRYVKPGGHFVSSFRLTTGATVNDMRRSWQYINFEGKQEGEAAPYVVLNLRELLGLFNSLNPAAIRGFGYNGAPSPTAVTPFSQVVFCVIAVQKRVAGSEPTRMVLDLPPELLAASV
ncbi:MAG TPA: class I SAM-dependent methyltransferase [Steroidobacteraceae bacterium]|nr:class I SAM-dependent methyltransferase [Steroidobacteraceae bacterium]